MSSMEVQRYSTEIKVYIVATTVVIVFIIGLIWWNSVKESERRIRLTKIYSSYRDLGLHIDQNINLDSLSVCRKLPEPERPEEEEGEDLDPEAVKKAQALRAEQRREQTQKIQMLTNHLTQQYGYLDAHRPLQDGSPELMTDAPLFRLNETYNEFTAALQMLSIKCGELTQDQIVARKRKFTRALARFNDNLKKLETPRN